MQKKNILTTLALTTVTIETNSNLLEYILSPSGFCCKKSARSLKTDYFRTA